MATQGAVAALLLTRPRRSSGSSSCSAALNGTSAAFFFPPSQGIVPQTVPEPMIQQANALAPARAERRRTCSAQPLGGAARRRRRARLGDRDRRRELRRSPRVFTAMLSLPEIVRERAPNFVRELAEGWSRLPLAHVALVDRRASSRS